MTYDIKFFPEAYIDIQEAKAYHNERKDKLGEEFFQHVEQAIERLKTNPFLFQRGYRGIRKAPVSKFNYSVFYFTEQKRVIVIAVLFNGRDPQNWKDRVK